MLIGYVRPHIEDINGDIQMDIIEKFDCERIFLEASDLEGQRSELKDLLESIEKDDKVIVERLSIIADSTQDLFKYLDIIDIKGAYISSIREGIDTSNWNEYRFSDIVKVVMEFQRDIISEKTKEGLSEAKQKGISPGRPRKSDANVRRAIDMYNSRKYSLSQIREKTGISKTTLYRYLDRHK